MVVGHVARLAKKAEERMQQAIELEGAGRERERLARDIHDSVLQVLALVQRRGQEIGGEAAELGRLAGEQEGRTARAGQAQARGVRPRHRRPVRPAAQVRPATVTVSAPATPLTLPAATAAEMAAAVGAALDNVARHCGARRPRGSSPRATAGLVTVTVRDEGAGHRARTPGGGRRRGAAGVRAVIRGRIADLGGNGHRDLRPRRGTEIEMSVPAG
ncbi:histidine kinase [Streptosporangium vulgare]|uniref:histidine kinase n=1 Tax=Streptosporangium vulgare TaxID=46190 RepID=UPI0031DD1BE6